MLRIDAKNTNYSGTSAIEDLALASFYGSTDTSSTININITIYEDGISNSNIIKSDLADFIDEIIADLS